MSMMRNGNVALSNLRYPQVALLILRKCHVPCHYIFNPPVTCRYIAMSHAKYKRKTYRCMRHYLYPYTKALGLGGGGGGGGWIGGGGAAPCRMLIIRNGNVALSILRKCLCLPVNFKKPHVAM